MGEATYDAYLRGFTEYTKAFLGLDLQGIVAEIQEQEGEEEVKGETKDEVVDEALIIKVEEVEAVATIETEATKLRLEISKGSRDCHSR